MLARVISAVLLAPLVLLAVYAASPLWFLGALGAAGTLCLFEYFRLAGRMGVHTQDWAGYAALWCLLAGLHFERPGGTAAVAAVVLALFLPAMWRHDPMRERVLTLMTNVLGVLWFGLFLFAAFQIRFAFGGATGLRWTYVLLATVWAGDMCAMAVGKTLGRTAFAPQISPKKTNEGAIGGLLGGVAAAVLLQQFAFPELPLPHVAAASALAGAFSQLGDLAESVLKRAAGSKDSSQLIPGHGGVLDRLDSLLFALPVMHMYLLALYR